MGEADDSQFQVATVIMVSYLTQIVYSANNFSKVVNYI